MRWKRKIPEHGEWRVRTKFAWLPIRTTLPDNNTILWLERYKVNEKYIHIWREGSWRTVQIAPLEYWA